MWKILNANNDFLVVLCLYLVHEYLKNAVANDKWFFATWVNSTYYYVLIYHTVRGKFTRL
jgi:hypothetical protein